MKKGLFIFIVTIFMVIGLVACGGEGSSPSDNNNSPPANSNDSPPADSNESPPADSSDGNLSGKISFYYWDERQKPAMDDIIRIMQKDTPDVEVESTIIPWAQYWINLQTSLAASDEPDVFWIDIDNAVDYVPAGLIQELSTFIARDNIDMSVFPESLVDSYQFGDNLYAMPKDYSTIAMYYNKALFDAQGLAYPNNDWTWDDLQTAATALTEGHIYGFAAAPWSLGVVYPWILSNGGTLMAPDNTMFSLYHPENVEAIQWLLDAMYVNGFSPDAASQLELDPNDRFNSGTLAMFCGGSWAASFYHDALGDDLGVARLPISQQEGNIIGGLGVSISARSQNKEAAWALVRAFSTREAGEAQAGVVIPAYLGTESMWVNNIPNLDLRVFINAAAQASPNPTPTIASAAQRAVVEEALQSIWMQAEDVETALRRSDGEFAAIVAGN